MFLNLGSGRGFSHTLLFVIISSLVVYLITRRNFTISFPFFIGNMFHLILDLPEIPIFFPFIQYDFIYIEDPLGGWLYSLFNDPVILITEITGTLILIFIVIHNRLYSGKKIINYLQNNTIELK